MFIFGLIAVGNVYFIIIPTHTHTHKHTQILCLHSWALQEAGLWVQMTCAVVEERPSTLSSKDQSLFVEPVEIVVKWGWEER